MVEKLGFKSDFCQISVTVPRTSCEFELLPIEFGSLKLVELGICHTEFGPSELEISIELGVSYRVRIIKSYRVWTQLWRVSLLPYRLSSKVLCGNLLGETLLKFHQLTEFETFAILTEFD